MSMARVVIMAVVLEGRTRSEVAREYGVSRRWVQKLVARYRVEGEAAFEPRSRRPRSNPRHIGDDVEDAIVGLRKQLIEAGHDAGAETIAWHLRRAGRPAPAVATIWRVLCPARVRHPAAAQTPAAPTPVRKPTCPTSAGRSTSPTGRLADGREVEILNIVDDHSRLLVGCHRPHRVQSRRRRRRPARRPSPATASRIGAHRQRRGVHRRLPRPTAAVALERELRRSASR